jgi:ribonucleoside-diphosphate reductase alpha chain
MADSPRSFVITRSGKQEDVNFDKVRQRIEELAQREPKIPHVNVTHLASKTIGSFSDNMRTEKIDELSATIAEQMGSKKPYYLLLAARIAIDNHHKETSASFLHKLELALTDTDSLGNSTPKISRELYEYVRKHEAEIQAMIRYELDFKLPYFGFNTFRRIYGLRNSDGVYERMQDMFMRVSVMLHMNSGRVQYIPITHAPEASNISEDLANIKETYDALASTSYSHASPTYFNAGSTTNQLASCFLMGSYDNTESICASQSEASKISRTGGGLGMHVHAWRGKGAPIRSTGGGAAGLVRFAKIFEASMVAFNQGGRRPGSLAMYLMPHHPSFYDFLNMRSPETHPDYRCPNLSSAIWVPDIFMRRTRRLCREKINLPWTFFDPDCHSYNDDSGASGASGVDLSNFYDETIQGGSYTNEYKKLEEWSSTTDFSDFPKLKPVTSTMDEIWECIFRSVQLTGYPYICFSDTANRLSNQKNLGIIKSSNLCSEIYEYSDEKETAVCILSSVNLSECVKYMEPETKEQKELLAKQLVGKDKGIPYFDFRHLAKYVAIVTRNLNKMIEKTYCPNEKVRRSNELHRPIGIGVQGLADAFIKMRYPWDSMEALELNQKIFETMYYAAVNESASICRNEWKRATKICRTEGSVTCKKWNENFEEITETFTDPKEIPKEYFAYPSMKKNGGAPLWRGEFHWELCGKKESKLKAGLDWGSLREKVTTFGTKNSLFIALMPTASTASLLGNNECFEPYTSNLYRRKTNAGDHIIANRHLAEDLYELGLWDEKMQNEILAHEGSVQEIEEVPEELKALYKTAYEVGPRKIIAMAAVRQPFVDQGQSMNLYVDHLSKSMLMGLMVSAWELGLKTGKYYFHTKPGAMPRKITLAKRGTSIASSVEEEDLGCLGCSA